MKKLLLIAITFIFSAGFSYASHIVGGEFEMENLGNNYYKISLHLYSDDINGDPRAIDPNLSAFIYRKSDNRLMTELWLPLTSRNQVNYSNIECEDGILKTSHVVYSNTFSLNPGFYNDPQGYYIVWERCCRNSVIINISAPSEAGQTFYLEFPPLNVVNSSPRLFPPLSDYACLGVPFNFNFAATDPNGDSLVYTLTTPLRGSSSSVEPAPYPPSVAPYAVVRWNAGYSETFQVPGSPTLAIGRSTGELSLTPTSLGLHVFAVKCEEYREGKKIGEVRREFQLMVRDCPDNENPGITFTNPNNNSPYLTGDTIHFDENSNQFRFVVKDVDQEDKLKIEAKAINFDQSRLSLSVTSGFVNSFSNSSDSLSSILTINTDNMVCEGPYQVRLIVKDNACSVPASDTVLVTFKYKEKPNTAPILTVYNPSDTIDLEIFKDSIRFNVLGTDSDGHLVQVKAEIDGKDPSVYGIIFNPLQGYGETRGTFIWKPGCEANQQDHYLVSFIINDSLCRPSNFDTVSVYFRLKLSNEPAVIYTTDEAVLTGGDSTIKVHIGSTIQFNVFGEDVDIDSHLKLAASGSDFELSASGMEFPEVEGNTKISSTFSWDASCEYIEFVNKPLKVKFNLTEQHCNTLIETISYTFELIDTTAKGHTPYNVLTPNGDGRNEYFSLDEVPLEVCAGAFQFVEVYNRWGRLVYKDTSEDFRWIPEKFSTGTYHYYIKLENKDFKGWVTIMR
jgi:gliding motility-associated-like protein